jgi:hypothetical protein
VGFNHARLRRAGLVAGKMRANFFRMNAVGVVLKNSMAVGRILTW